MTHLEQMQAWALDIAQAPPADRRPTLLAWARSDQNISGYLFEDSPLADIAAEAIKTLSAEIHADTPGNIWRRSRSFANRKPVLTALKIDASLFEQMPQTDFGKRRRR